MGIDWRVTLGGMDDSTAAMLARKQVEQNQLLNIIKEKDALETNKVNRDTLSEARMASAEDRKAQTKQRQLTAAQARLKTMRPGDEVTPDAAEEIRAAGLGHLLNDNTAAPVTAQVTRPVAAPVADVGSGETGSGPSVPEPAAAAAPPAPPAVGSGEAGSGPTLIDAVQQAKAQSGEKPKVTYKGTPDQVVEQQRIKDISDYVDETDEAKKKILGQKLALNYKIKSMPMADGSSHLYQVTADGVQDLGEIPGLKAPKIMNQPAANMGGAIDDTAAKAMAHDYLTTGHAPAMGRGGWGSPVGQQVAKAMKDEIEGGLSSGDLATSRAAYKAATTAYNKLKTNYTQVNTSAAIAFRNLDLASAQGAQVGRTDSQWVNDKMQAFMKGATSTPGLTDFEVKIYTAAREYAKVSTGSSASVAELSAAATKQVETLLNAAQSPATFAAAVDSMKADMKSIVGANAETLSGLQDQIKTAGQGDGMGSQSGRGGLSNPGGGGGGPKPPVGTRRTVKGVLLEYDGTGWAPPEAKK